MKEVKVSTLTRPAQPRAARLRVPVMGTAAGTAASVRVAGTGAAILNAYLPLSGGTLSGDLTLQHDNSRLYLRNRLGNGVFLELNTAANILALYPAGATAKATLRAAEVNASEHLTLDKGAVVRSSPSGAAFYYDADRDAWIFNRPVYTSGDLVAFATL